MSDQRDRLSRVSGLGALNAAELEFLALAVDRRCGHLTDLISLQLTPAPAVTAAELGIGRGLQSAIATARERLAGQ